ncbi:uncharacterized protein DS421_14g452800 [Arachis hypogaea]|nr:uncharacterized protein DS421_14g452800 [Arachis hypogaea]
MGDDPERLYHLDGVAHISGVINDEPQRCILSMRRQQGMRLDESAFVERWRPETHTFHMPFRECTITLQDVAYQLGLPVDGRYESLGVLPPANQIQKFAVNCTWFQETFGECPEGADDATVRRYARAYIMMLLGTQLFADKSGNRIHIRWLPYVARLEEMGGYSWGYFSLGSFGAFLGLDLVGMIRSAGPWRRGGQVTILPVARRDLECRFHVTNQTKIVSPHHGGHGGEWYGSSLGDGSAHRDGRLGFGPLGDYFVDVPTDDHTLQESQPWVNPGTLFSDLLASDGLDADFGGSHFLDEISAIMQENDAARRWGQMPGTQAPLDVDLNEPPTVPTPEYFSLGGTPPSAFTAGSHSVAGTSRAPVRRESVPSGSSSRPLPVQPRPHAQANPDDDDDDIEDEEPLVRRGHRTWVSHRCFTDSHLFR